MSLACRIEAALMIVAIALVWTGQAVPAGAQDDDRNVTVTDRERVELEPLGVRVGGFLVFPTLGVEQRYDDNIFSDEVGTKSDFVSVAAPGLTLRSDWNNHALNGRIGGTVGRYWRNNSENFDDITVAGDGRLDITIDSKLTGAASYATLHEDRGSPDDVSGDEPTEYTLGFAGSEFTQRFNRLTTSIDSELLRYDFDDVATSAGRANNDDRDRWQGRIGARAGWELVPEYQAFIRGGINTRSYDETVDDAGFDRDSWGLELVTGIALDLGGITSGELFIGYANQDYDGPALDTVGGLTGGANITWIVTPLTTVTGGFQRTIEETTIEGAGGFFSSQARLAVDHELLRNLLLNANASLRLNDYEGVEREEIVFRGGLGAKYLMNRNVYVVFEYIYTSRDTAAPRLPDDYNKNFVALGIELHY